MLVFSTSDKGGTGRSVTSANVAYRAALQGNNVCYVDFDFGSPTAGAVFSIDHLLHGTESNGVHSYLQGRAAEPVRQAVWGASGRDVLRTRPDRAGELVLMPGDHSGGEFPGNQGVVDACMKLFLALEQEFDVSFIDLSAGRSHATEVAMAATASDTIRRRVKTRWLVFHRWTRQHVIAADSLVRGERGLLQTGVAHGHDERALEQCIKFVRTAVADPNSKEMAGLAPTQVSWLRQCDSDLHRLAKEYRVGRINLLDTVPLDPVLQWREQLLTDVDVHNRKIANHKTVDAFDRLAKSITDDEAWPRM
ncbi:SCO2523 family variant P-loop protein [Natronoglycomyces albus]|uniref:ParA family protein n=1 Tax=Natronoglycomyces albus TaxID=2811108 RepID=A0A895XJR5_9ACTN|nr:SCO2523 family variant P-loop protein [Natronoglycomyces albus]QSB06001.1 ParA family protein [Natronoglycomyces albus]